jgi:putative nucleotidyltransferase with HDIG domain
VAEADGRELAERHLAAALPRRWRHVQAVAAEAERLCDIVHIDAAVVVTAAWLHDLGYAPTVADTGFHPLDGARHLRAHGWNDDVCRLVAHHTDAARHAPPDVAAQLRAEFPELPGLAQDLLWTADVTTGPDGEHVTLEERIAEITARYGPEHDVSRHMIASKDALGAAVARARSASRPDSD